MVTNKLLQRKIPFENKTGQRQRAHTHTASKHIGSLCHIESNNTGCHADTVWWWFCATCECADSPLLRHFLCSLSFPLSFHSLSQFSQFLGYVRPFTSWFLSPLPYVKQKGGTRRGLVVVVIFLWSSGVSLSDTMTWMAQRGEHVTMQE